MTLHIPVKVHTLSNHLSRQDRLRISTTDKRFRNRSLCSMLYTPPPYPGYSSVLSSIRKSNDAALSTPNPLRNTSNRVCTYHILYPENTSSKLSALDFDTSLVDDTKVKEFLFSHPHIWLIHLLIWWEVIWPLVELEIELKLPPKFQVPIVI